MQSEIEYVEVAGATLWTIRQGRGPALVLCHGGPGMWDYLGPVAGMVDDLATVYRYDQRACGRSSGDSAYGMDAAMADLEALRAHWGLAAWVVGGHSFGATLALAYALTYPARTRGLIYLSGTGVDPGWRADYRANRAARMSPDDQRRMAELRDRLANAEGTERAALDRAVNELAYATDIAVADRERARELARSLLVDGVQVNYAVNRELGKDHDRFATSDATRERLRALAVPTLVAHGELDLRPAWAARQVADLLPHARFALLSGAGHNSWLEQPALVRETLRAFLTSL